MSVELSGLMGIGNNSFNLGNIDNRKHDSLATSTPNNDLNTIFEGNEGDKDDLINQMRKGLLFVLD